MTMWWGGGRERRRRIHWVGENRSLSCVYVCLSISDIFSLNQSTLEGRSLTLKCSEQAESLLYNAHNNRIIHHHGWIFSTGQKANTRRLQRCNSLASFFSPWGEKHFFPTYSDCVVCCSLQLNVKIIFLFVASPRPWFVSSSSSEVRLQSSLFSRSILVTLHHHALFGACSMCCHFASDNKHDTIRQKRDKTESRMSEVKKTTTAVAEQRKMNIHLMNTKNENKKAKKKETFAWACRKTLSMTKANDLHAWCLFYFAFCLQETRRKNANSH